jgi:hypothetical protein
MKRQIIAILTLGSFIVFSFSCYSVQPVKLETLASTKAKDMDIVRLEKTSGESIVFSESQLGRVDGQFIRGIGAVESSAMHMEIDKAQVKMISRQGDKIVSITTQDNKTYLVQKIFEKAQTLEVWCVLPIKIESISVLLSDVEKAWEKKLDTANSFLVIMLSCAAIFGIVIWNGLQHWTPVFRTT